MDNSLVDSVDQIATNILTLHEYGKGKPTQQKFHNGRIKNGKLFVTLLRDQQYLFAPSKFAGYKNNTTKHMKLSKKRDGRITNRRITKLIGKPLDIGDKNYGKIDKKFRSYCKNFDIVPSKHHRSRRYWYIEDQFNITDISYPDDIQHPDKIIEGAKVQTYVNSFERSSKARRQCLKHYGYACCVCGFSFRDRYGELGNKYMHVHHITPLSDIRERYVVDPIRDLRPVCPNCHSMLHREEPALTIRELKKKLKN